MANDSNSSDADKKRLQDEKKQLKKQQREQKKEIRRRAREISKEEEDLGDDGNGFAAFGATVLIVLLWIAIICIIVKLDIGGFGSAVLTPILKDVPVVNKILPGNNMTETNDPDSYGGYSSLKDAVEYIKQLELELEKAQVASKSKDADLETLKAEVTRLKEFENKQVEFQRIRNQFYEEVIYSENGPGAADFQKWYESMDPTTAEYLYKQVVVQLQESAKVQDYAKAYAGMKPKEAAKIFDAMTNELDLVAKILNTMSAEDRGKIMAQMDVTVAAKLTKLMDPDS